MTVVSFRASELTPEYREGSAEILRSPKLSISENALYVPAGVNLYFGGWGLFGPNGNALDLSIPLRGNAERPFKHVDNFANDSRYIPRLRGRYFYLGQIQAHYGHFLLEGLSRMWAFREWKDDVAGVIYHGTLPPNELLSKYDYIKVLLELLGVREENLVRPEARVRLDAIVVPEPAMQLRRHIYAEFVALFSRMREGLDIEERTESPSDARLYLSKSRLVGGLSKVLNESELEISLKTRGASIFFPEECDLPTQIATLDRYKTILGCTGSGLHSILLAKRGKVLKYVVPGSKVNSNYPMIDLAMGNNAMYYFAEIRSVKHEKFAFPVNILNIEELVEHLA